MTEQTRQQQLEFKDRELQALAQKYQKLNEAKRRTEEANAEDMREL